MRGSYLKAGGSGWGWGPQKSIYSTGQYIWKPLPLQPDSLSLSFTASYLDRRQHKGNWYYIVRADINPWYFHCSPLKVLFSFSITRQFPQSEGVTPTVKRDSDTSGQRRRGRKETETAAAISSVFFFFCRLCFCFVFLSNTKVFNSPDEGRS